VAHRPPDGLLDGPLGPTARSLNRHSALPAYFQLALDLRRRVAEGEWAEGQRIPPELELAEDYAVSRVTVRQALAELVKDDLLERHRGSGTYVRNRQQPIVYDLGLTGGTFAARMREKGAENRAEVIHVGRIDPAPATVQSRLQLRSSSEAVYMVRRIILAGQPGSLARSWFDPDTVPGIEASPRLSGSLASLLAEDYGLVPSRTENQIEVVRSTSEETAMLGNAADAPLLVVTSTSYLPDGRPLEFSQVEWLGDRVRLHLVAYVEDETGRSPVRS
jgi:GntR family transcriptional regulator